MCNNVCNNVILMTNNINIIINENIIINIYY